MSLTSYRAAPPRGSGCFCVGAGTGFAVAVAVKRVWLVWRGLFSCLPVGRPGDDRLSRVLGRSTIGAEGFHGRVRNGIGCWAPRYDHQVVRPEGRTVPVSCLKENGGVGTTLARVRDHQKQQTAHKGAVRCFPIQEKDGDQANRAIRTGRLNALLRVHPRPINVVVFHGSQARPGLEGGFPLRCLQRLSRPHIATRRCRWRDNRYTRGASIPVLSY